MKLRYLNVIIVAVVLAAVAAIAVNVSRETPEARSNSLLEGRSLVDAPNDEINQYALQYTQENYVVIGVPQILFSKAVTAQEAVDLGLGIGNSIEAKRQYHAIILQGSFVRPATGIKQDEAYRYIGYVFDLEAGIPTTIIDSASGASLKQALGDSSLPDSPVPLRKPADLSYDPEDYAVGVPIDVPVDTTFVPSDKPVEGDYVQEYVDSVDPSESTP